MRESKHPGESIESTESTMVAVNVQTLIDAYLIDFMPKVLTDRQTSPIVAGNGSN